MPSMMCSSREEGLISNSAIYQSIAASLLSTPQAGRPESPMGSMERDDILLHGYNLPLGSSSMDTAPFKMTSQTSAASAMIGL
ncbi:unnamed protein product [Lymnaea stagnalis]|uniref:Uncharacterized protein n=1 Tax=Lymnaea stagnalis TaxID=6523 RepID=A0AAV2HYY0_LYMST